MITGQTTNAHADPKEEARHAIRYLLQRIETDPDVAWHFVATESYERLINAYALLSGKTVAEVRGLYAPRATRCCWRCEEREQAERERRKA